MTNTNGSAKPADPFAAGNLKNFFKYCSDDPGVIKGIFEDHKIRFTQPAALNDPLEFNPILRFERTEGKYTNYLFDGILFPSEETRIRHQLIERQFNAFAILSLTKVPDSFDMWSRYANGHHGFLLELKADFNKHRTMLSRDGTTYDVREVTYVDEYAVDIDDLVDGRGWIPFGVFNDQAFFSKTSRWEEEHEYRMVRKLADHADWSPKANKAHRDRGLYLFDFPADCLQSVIFGACMEIDNKRKIMQACEGMSIDFMQAYVLRDGHDRWRCPGIVQFAKVGSLSDLGRWGDLGVFVERNHIQERLRPPVSVTALTDLPYYSGDEKWVARYYESQKSRRGR